MSSLNLLLLWSLVSIPITSAVVDPYCIKENHSFTFASYSSYSSPSLTSCDSDCQSDTNCFASEYNHGTGTCQLFNRMGSNAATSNVDIIWKYCNVNCTFYEQHYPGNNANAPGQVVADFPTCRDLCTNEPTCVAAGYDSLQKKCFTNQYSGNVLPGPDYIVEHKHCLKDATVDADGWVHSGTHKYFIETIRLMTYDEAKSECIGKCGYLMEYNSREEFVPLSSYIRQMPYSVGFMMFVGLTSNTSTTWDSGAAMPFYPFCNHALNLARYRPLVSTFMGGCLMTRDVDYLAGYTCERTIAPVCNAPLGPTPANMTLVNSTECLAK